MITSIIGEGCGGGGGGCTPPPSISTQGSVSDCGGGGGGYGGCTDQNFLPARNPGSYIPNKNDLQTQPLCTPI